MAVLENGDFVFSITGNPSCGYSEGVSRIPQGISDSITSNGSAVAVSADGSMVAFGHTEGGYIAVYLTDGWVRQTIAAFSGTQVNGLAFSPDGSKLAVAHATSPYVTIYNTSDWSKISNPATLPTGVGNGVAWSPDGSQLAVAHVTTPYMTIYNVSDWSKRENPANLPTANGNCVAWSPDGSQIALGMGASPYIRIYNASDLSNAASAPSPGGVANAIEYSPDGSKLAMGINTSPYIKAWNTADWSSASPPTVPTTVNDVSWVHNSELLIAINAYPRIMIWNLSTGATSTRTGVGSSCEGIAANKYTPKTISGSVKDSGGNGILRTVRAYRRDTGELVGSANSNPATGNYSISCRYSVECDVVMLDDAAGTLENDQILRTTPV